MSICRIVSCVVGRGCLLFLLWSVLLRWWSRRACTHLLLWELTRNSLLNKHWQENVESHQEKIPHIQGQRRSPNKTAGGAKLCLESKPIPARDAQRVQTKPVCIRNHEPHKRLRESHNYSTYIWITGSDCLCGNYSGKWEWKRKEERDVKEGWQTRKEGKGWRKGGRRI